jgi:hypothetical protein
VARSVEVAACNMIFRLSVFASSGIECRRSTFASNIVVSSGGSSRYLVSRIAVAGLLIEADVCLDCRRLSKMISEIGGEGKT